MATDTTSHGSVTGGSSGAKQSPSGMPSPWSIVGGAADAVGGIFPEADNYKGKYGNLSAGADAAYDSISSAVMQINPMVGGIMKLGALGTKALHAAGVGTDGMCVCAGTVVYTASGKPKAIERLSRNDGVIGWCERTDKVAVQEITYIHGTSRKQCVRMELDDGKVLRCSFDHPVLSRGTQEEYSFSAACTLSPGDKVRVICDGDPTCARLTEARVVSVDPIGVQEVYNLSVGPDHTYVANGIITHNTKKDAIMDSSFMALTPWGLANAIGARKSDTMDVDKETLALGGDSYSGAADAVNDASQLSGKKYGLFSRKEMNAANRQMADAGRMQNNMGTIVNRNKMMMDALVNQQDMNNQQYLNMMNGMDWSNMALSAKNGGILPSAYQIAHRVAYRHKWKKQQAIPEFVPQMISDQQVDMFQNGGQMSLLPEGALHKDKHHIEEVRDDLKGEITHKGIPVVTIAKDGKQVEQVAEIEHSEWILSADLTDKIEKLRDQYNESDDAQEKQEFAIEAGKLISDEIMENTDDRVGLIKKIKV